MIGGGGRHKSHPISSPKCSLNLEPPIPAAPREKWVYLDLSCSCVGAERGLTSRDVLGLSNLVLCLALLSATKVQPETKD